MPSRDSTGNESPPPHGDTVAIIWADTHDWAQSVVDLLRRFAGSQTRRRVANLRQPHDRAATLAAHAGAEILGSLALDVAPGRARLGHSCPACGSTGHGRPHIAVDGIRAPLQVSLSHSRHTAVVALARHSPVGVDVEVGDAQVPLLPELFVRAERLAALEDPSGRRARDLWTAKEALAKLGGRGLDARLGRVDVLATSVDRWTCAAVEQSPPDPAVWLRHLDLPGDRSATVARPGPGPLTVTQLDAEDLAAAIRGDLAALTAR